MIYQGTAGAVLEALRSFDLKAERRNRYRSNSPLRPESNSHAFTLTLHDEEHGAFYDHVTQECGSLYQLAERLGIGRPSGDQTAGEKPAKQQYRDLAEYADAHWAPAEVFEQAGWRTVQHGGRPALAFPTSTGTRYRYLDAQSPKYRSPTGYERCWYRLAEAIELAGDQALVICNGEASTIVAQHHGLAATCITGGEKAAVPEQLIEQLRRHWNGPVRIAFDADATGRRAGPQLAAQLQAAGIDAQAIDLMPGISDGFDLADFCGLHQEHSRTTLAGRPIISPSLPFSAPATGRPATRPRLVHASRLGEVVEKITWLIPGVIGLNSISQMFGAPGSGKSLLALDQALCVAQVAPVIYIAGEAAGEQEDRIAAWCRHHNRGVGQLYFWPEPVTLKDQTNLDEFIAEALTVQPAMIVIDPLASCMVGLEESSTGDMTVAVDALNRIRKATGAAIHVVHHTGWNENHERGNSALRGACRVVIKLSSDDSGLMTLSSEKANNGKPFEARYFRLVEAADSVTPIPSSKVETRSAALTMKHIEILEALELQQHSDGATFTNILDYTGQSKSTLHKGINRLLERGLITRERQIYSLSDAGRRKLAAVNQTTEFPSSPGSSPSELGVNWAVNWERTNGELAHQDAEFTQFTPEQAAVHPGSPAAGGNQFTVNTAAAERTNGELAHQDAKFATEQPAVHPGSPVAGGSQFTVNTTAATERTNGDLAHQDAEFTQFTVESPVVHPGSPAASENQFTVNSASESDSSPQFTASSPISSPSEFTSSPPSRSLERERSELMNSEPGEPANRSNTGTDFQASFNAQPQASTSPRLALIAELEQLGGALPAETLTIEELQALVNQHRTGPTEADRLAEAAGGIAQRLAQRARSTSPQTGTNKSPPAHSNPPATGDAAPAHWQIE